MADKKANNRNLTKAKSTKNDEFYTQYHDIEREINAYLEYNPNVFRGKTILLPCDDPEWSNFTKFFAQNFENFGLKKLISTSFAPDSKLFKGGYQPTLFETSDPQYDERKTITNGKIFTLTHDKTGDGKIDVEDLEWTYMEGSGDFKSNEIKALRNESDIIITNPPFSLFRDFLPWILEAKKKFIIIANKTSVTYKEVFPLIKNNEIWSGRTEWTGGLWFETKNEDDIDKIVDGINLKNVPAIWLTNIEHGRRHQPIPLMSLKDNLKFSKYEVIRTHGYQEFDNYKALFIPYTDSIPNDYEDIMGVPISFLDKYSPEQFEIIGSDYEVKEGKLNKLIKPNWKGKLDRGYVNGVRKFPRILIKHKNK